jgi:hypothetical protein
VSAADSVETCLHRCGVSAVIIDEFMRLTLKWSTAAQLHHEMRCHLRCCIAACNRHLRCRTTIASHSQHGIQYRIVRESIVRHRATRLQLFAREDQSLLIRRHSCLRLNHDVIMVSSQLQQCDAMAPTCSMIMHRRRSRSFDGCGLACNIEFIISMRLVGT